MLLLTFLFSKGELKPRAAECHAQDLGARQLQSLEQPPSSALSSQMHRGRVSTLPTNAYTCLLCTPHYATSESRLLPRDVFKLMWEGDQSEGTVTD